jgi:hypothetical protein
LGYLHVSVFYKLIVNVLAYPFMSACGFFVSLNLIISLRA